MTKKCLVLISCLVIMSSLVGDERYTKTLHEYLLEEGIDFLNFTRQYSLYNGIVGDGAFREAMLSGVADEDESDWGYGYSHTNGPYVEVHGVNDIVEYAMQSYTTSISHFWDADNFMLNETTGHHIESMYLEGDEYTFRNIPHAASKAYKYMYGSGARHFKEWSYALPSEYQRFNLVEGGSVMLGNVFSQVRLSLYSMSDFIWNHNINVSGTYDIDGSQAFYDPPYYVHLSDYQYNRLMEQHPNIEAHYLGHMIHLLMDMCVPAHVKRDGHPPNFDSFSGVDLIHARTIGCDEYEGWDACNGTVSYSSGGFLSSLDNVYWDHSLVQSSWPGFVQTNETYSDEEFLLALFYSVNQVTDMFASDDRDGDFVSHALHPFSDYPFIGQATPLVQSSLNQYPNLQTHHEITDNNERCAIRDVCVPMTIKAVATLLDWYGHVRGFEYDNWTSGCVTLTDNPIVPPTTWVTLEGPVTRYVHPEATGIFTTCIPPGEYSVTYQCPGYVTHHQQIVCTDNFTIPAVELQPFSNPVLVSQNPDVIAFRNIREAVYAVLSIPQPDEQVKILVAPGVYSSFAIFGEIERNIKITGTTQSGVIIEESSNSPGIWIDHNIGSLIALENLTVQNCENGGLSIDRDYPSTNCQYSLSHMKFIDNELTNYGDTYDEVDNSGAGVFCNGPLTISYCEFTGNSCHENDFGFGYGGGLYIDNDTETASLISKSTFSSNWAQNGGAVYYTGEGPLTITDCRVTDNTLAPPIDGSAGHDVGIYVENCPDLLIEECIIDNNHRYLLYGTHYNGLSPLTINNCDDYRLARNTIANNEDLNGVYSRYSPNGTISNTIFQGNKRPIDSNAAQINIEYCCWDDAEASDFNGGNATVTACLDTDPNLDANYMPIWNETYRSPVIDAGNPDMDGDEDMWYDDEDDCDNDGTQRDIGAVVGQQHIQATHTLAGEGGWSWISFPSMDKVYEGDVVDDIDYIFNEYNNNGLLREITPILIEEITWDYNEDAERIRYIPGVGFNDTDKTVHSRYGYKVQTTEAASDLLMQYAGFRCGESYNADDEICLEYATEQPDPNRDPYNEVWLGYWLDKTLKPLDALEAVKDDLIMIKAEHWCLVRNHAGDEETYPWFGMVQRPYDAVIEPGMCVVVQYANTEEDACFTWGDGDPSTPNEYEEAEYYTYTEEEDYVPIYVDLDETWSGVEGAELAVYYNEVCYGAVVIKADTVQINAYIVDKPEIDLEDVVFRYWEPTKRGEAVCEKSISEYAVLDTNTEKFYKGGIVDSEPRSFYFVTLDADGATQDAPFVTALSGNYPNPFNPETTISFSISEDAPVQLDVYNVRGQRVRTLVNEHRVAGKYDVVWDGRNNQNQPVSSGVYFYRLRTQDKTLTKKMLLLK